MSKDEQFREILEDAIARADEAIALGNELIEMLKSQQTKVAPKE